MCQVMMSTQDEMKFLFLCYIYIYFHYLYIYVTVTSPNNNSFMKLIYFYLNSSPSAQLVCTLLENASVYTSQ
jgi:hypothetical protein